ncbi:GerMN domain-containing protein [Sciscionella sediminilitoris]|uniref:GerMN domain-containing protein n=1 Tax=Sciscionella sediminilitoris TaxID=1445613 RepID=UPI0004DFA66E|nr:hypothetical protein [Sciscionella sp. SE31]
MRKLLLTGLILLLAGCGIQPAGVTDTGKAPTGLAPGVTLYFVDTQQRLRPQLRRSGNLGTVTQALLLLFKGPGEADGSRLHTEIPETTVAAQVDTATPGVIEIRVPFDVEELSPRAVDQIVCTALGVHRQSGGAKQTKVRIAFTHGPEAASQRLRGCPLLP